MPSMRAGSEVMRASVAASGSLCACAPLQRERQQQLEPGRARLGLGERQLLAVLVDRRVVGAQRSRSCRRRAPRAQRVAVALAAQRRLEAAVRVEVADVDVGQVQRGGCRRRRSPAGPPPSRARTSSTPPRARQPAQVHARAGGAHQLEDRARARSSRRTPGCRAGRGASRPRRRARRRRCASQASCGAQPDRVAEGRRVLQRAPAAPACRRAARSACEKRDAAGVGELGHLGQRARPASFTRQRADRIDARAVQRLGARGLSISTRPGSSSGGSVSGGQARLVTPPATAASISDSSVALYS